MDRPLPPPHLAVPGVLLFTAASSFLGLSGRFLVDQDGVVAFIGGVWRAGFPLADLLFVAGSAVTAVAGFRLALDGRVAASLVTAFVLTEVTYVVSFLALPMFSDLPSPVAFPEVVFFVTGWGFLGLGFATVAPLVAASWWYGRAGAVTAPRASSGPGAP